MDRYRYYRSILSVMLAIDSIDPSVKNFSFLTDSIDHRFKKKFIFSIESNHRLKIFFSSKDHRSNRCFLQLIDYRYRSNRCFFRHRCPPMVLRSYVFGPQPKPTHEKFQKGCWKVICQAHSPNQGRFFFRLISLSSYFKQVTLSLLQVNSSIF